MSTIPTMKDPKYTLLFKGWDLPVKVQGEVKNADGSSVMSGNACLNLAGMEAKAMREFIEANNLNPDVDKAIILLHDHGTETLLYPELPTTHGVIQGLKARAGLIPDSQRPEPPPSFPRMSKEEILEALPQYYGSERFYRLGVGNAVMTEGVQFLAEAAGAHWLMTDLSVVQSMKKELRMQPFLCAILKLQPPEANKQPAVLTVTDGAKNVLYMQKYDDTDFPLEEITLWLEENETGGKTILLPSEH